MICVGVSCNLAYNFTTNVHSDMVCSGMQKLKVILHVGDGAVVKL